MRAVLLSVALVCACGGKKSGHDNPAPEVTGLAAVPESAESVVGADVGKLIASPVLARAAEQLLLRDPSLQQGWATVQEGCKIDPEKQLKRVMFAIGPVQTPAGVKPQPQQHGTGPVLMVAVGNLPETALSDCIGKIVGKGSGTVTGTSVGDRTLYLAKDGNREVYFSYGRPDTVVLGS